MDGELWDVTDAAGRPVGRTHRRGDPGFPAGLFHVVSATCVVRDDGQVLLTQRAAIKDWPLAWEFPAGSALAGETSAEAASRELFEEAGLRAEPEALIFVGRFTEVNALLDLYVAHGVDVGTLELDPTEVRDSEWVSLAEVRDRYRAGGMAGPWVDRLEALWERLVAAVRGADAAD
ncbi:hypothetical protein ASD65_05440 [Microbacterium sp. Root61]|uniref:NUDIX hydrolase n=1 Tax=Microbacterium sp. Root61 TaxID=1736570 RepID=UPI0006F91465|nr:NUDIX hydrolase [Microbacterium sp. Root61]KRA23926.1 hypothetical protein ASD65_05440 [Microbacterium sp. Root61]